MSTCQYLEALGIHYIDYSGWITMDIGLERLESYADYFESQVENLEPFLLLFDASNTQWESPETHLELARIARSRFDVEPYNHHRFTAIVNHQYHDFGIGNERWFTTNEAALNWLFEQSR